MTEHTEPSAPTEESPESQPSVAGKVDKTPMFEAIHSARYERQERIRRIQERTKRALVCFVCGSRGPVQRDDVMFFVDLLQNIAGGAYLELMVHTVGGDVDAAEKLFTLARTRVNKGHLRVIVPDYAKSAGT